jgi:crossover junction endodeoxyribonuclease RusA
VSNTLNFTVHGKAQPAGSKRFVGTSGSGKGLVIDQNPHAADWKKRVAQIAAEERDKAGWEIIRGALRLSVHFQRARLKSHYSKRGASLLLASAPAYWATRPDRGKLLRAVEDALTGVIYADDSQVVGGDVVKSWGPTDCVEIHVAPLEWLEKLD